MGMSDNNRLFAYSLSSGHAAKFALCVVLVACVLTSCAPYTPATATVPAELPLRLTGRMDAMDAAMRAAAKHQELTVVGAPRSEGEQTTFMLLGAAEETGVAVVTKVGGGSGVEGEVVVTAELSQDSSGVRAGRLVADFRQRWEQLRRTGFAPLPTGWQ